jgi:hypothetical protein
MILLNQLEEYNDHFRGCFFQIKNNNEWEIVRSEGKDGDSYHFRELTMHNNNFNLSRTYSVSGSETEVDLTYPSLGLINTTTDVRHVSRKPSRQYRKAFRSESNNTSPLFCTNQIKTQYELRSRNPPLFSYHTEPVIYHIFKNEYYSLDQAIEMIMNGDRLSVAITPKFAISLNLYNLTHFTVYHKKHLIGLLHKETKELRLLSSYTHLYNEIRFTLNISTIHEENGL